MTFVVFPAGQYIVGSPPDEAGRAGDQERHSVTLTRPFAICDREITWEQMRGFDESIEFDRRAAGEKQFGRTLTDVEPAFGVNWYEAARYCRWLGAQAGVSENEQPYADPKSLKPEEYPSDPDPTAGGAPRNWPVNLAKYGFRLPTEAEWEIVCRSGFNSAYSFGDDASLLEHYACFYDNAARENSQKWSLPVGSLRPNGRGLYDIHGNVYEWCHDLFDIAYEHDAVDPLGPATGTGRVGRGGGWSRDARNCRAANRVSLQPVSRNSYLGLRVLVVP
jgi:formylglycine-generating enzyme required for sulfatase activity